MTDEEFLEIVATLSAITPIEIEYRVYYDTDGKIITYTTEKIEGQYIVITAAQYAESRHDALIIDNQLIYTHRRTYVSKLEKNKTDGIKTSKYDMSVISTDDDSPYYTMRAYEIK
jgi:hypothetical protein